MKPKKTQKPFQINFNLDRKYIIAILQIFYFLFIILPMVINLYNPIYVIPILILEFLSFIPFIYKKSVRYSIIIWVVQFYIAALLNIIIQPALFFNVPEVSSTAANTLLLLLTLAVIPILVLTYFKEKMIKPVLFGLSSATTIVVILIVGFIVIEGIPAFEQTNPVDFLTGDDWNIQTTRSFEQDEKLTVNVKNYEFLFTPEDTYFYRTPSKNSSVNIEIKNTGGKKDEYYLFYNASKNLQKVKLNNNYLSLKPQEKTTVYISFFCNQSTKENIKVSCVSNRTNAIITENITINFGFNGVELTPNIVKHTETQMSIGSINFILKNTGKIKQEYIVKIKADSFFNPFVREINNKNNWDFENSQGNITLKAGESKKLGVKPNMKNKVVGEHLLYIEVKSVEYPKIKENSTIFFKQIKKNIFEINETSKTIPMGGEAKYHIKSIPKGEIIVKINNLSEKFNFRLEKNSKIISNNSKNIKLEINDQHDKLTLIVSSAYIVEEFQEKFSFEIKTIKKELTLGILEFLIGSFSTTLIAILIAAPLGVGVAIFLSEFCNKKIKPGLRFMYDLLAGIPSVVYGLFGFLTFGPLLGESIFPFMFGVESFNGRCILTASLILSLMIIPIIIALSEDAIQSVDRGLKEGSLAMGSTRWQMMTRVVLPRAKSGIVASIILAVGRAIGETMAVSMIMGGSTGIPHLGFPNFLMDRVGTMTSEIALNFGWAVGFPDARAALFALATVLFIIVFILNGIVFSLRKKTSKKRRKSINYFFGMLFTKILSKKIAGKSQRKKFFGEKISFFNKEKKIDKKSISLNEIKSYFDHSNIMRSTNKAIRSEKIMKIVLLIGVIFATCMLFFIIADIVYRGGSNLQLHYFFKAEAILNPSEGGFANAIVGSLQLVGIALAVATPLSIGSAIYIVEYAKKENIFTRIILFMSDTLASTPSIVFGAFGYVFFIFFLDFKQSLFVGGLTLGFMVIPLLLRSSIEAFKSIPDNYREGSLALGATKWQTIRNVVIPPASPGVSSGVIISIGRAIGETAAIIFTAGYFRHFAQSILEPVGSMPNLIWNYYSESLSFPELGAKVYSAAMVLLIIVIFLNLISKLVAHRSKKMMK